MKDMDFFHQATLRICGSLDIQLVLRNCFDFLKGFMPVNSIQMGIYKRKLKAIQVIAAQSDPDFLVVREPVPLPEDAQAFVESSVNMPVELINTPATHIVGRHVWAAMEKKPMSVLVLHLAIDNEKLGVVDIIAKGFNRYTSEHARLFDLLHDPFAIALANTLKHREVLRLQEILADDNRYLNRQLHQQTGDEIIGAGFGLRHVMEQVRQVAPLTNHVLLLGETGVGKEVIANAIHYASPRNTGPFIKVNCGAIPENLIDSELFGYEKGAFTGALSTRRGRFERADKGTIFLDEIGELPPQAQIRLLRVLQTREIERVGGGDPIPVDIRIIAATHRNLEAMVHEGTFREDLWFRLNVFPIPIPPLRYRRSDIPALVFHFLEKKSREMNIRKIPDPAPGSMERLQSHTWPGNVRELENLVERSLIRHLSAPPDTPLSIDIDLRQPAGPASGIPPQENPSFEGPLELDDVMRNHIRRVLELTKGRIQGEKGAAAVLGIHPSTLRNRMNKLHIPYGRSADLD